MSEFAEGLAVGMNENRGYGNGGFDPFDDPMFRFFFGEPQRTPRQEQQQSEQGDAAAVPGDGPRLADAPDPVV